MKTYNERLNTARAVGTMGCDSCVDEQLVFATVWSAAPEHQVGWYGFYCANEVVVTDVVFLDKLGNDLALVPTWEDATLPAGCWIPAGVIGGEDAYISDITCTGTIILYSD
ncbi:unnamed protein product [marine sediment metagenome]|uniref:Uncharacterized protein n=1 Tax=marine sediment metagenome TaxID=412755 RepID=X0RWJ3_9ZZZZ